MIKKSLKWAADVLNAKLILQDPLQDSFFGAAIDSRQIQDGMLYIPIIGARVDGHSFAADVKDKGAAAVLWQKDHPDIPEGINVILVDDTKKALGALAKAWWEQIRPLTIGITGSNGKTSTKDMLASIVSRSRKTVKTEKNRNSEFGMPLTIFDMDLDTEALILEMGLEFPGDILYLCSLVELDGAVITSIGSAHMENFGNKSGIAKGKLEILSSLKPGGVFVYNKDASELDEQIQDACSLYSVSPEIVSCADAGSDAVCRLDADPEYDLPGMRFSCQALGLNSLFVNALGSYQASNALCAAAMASALGISREDIVSGLKDVQLTGMRGTLHSYENGWIFDDTYKSNPEAAMQALDALVMLPGSHHAAFLADMLDLGDETERLHAETGAYAKKIGVDALITYGELSRNTAEAFGKGALHVEKKTDALPVLKELLKNGSVILFKGSRAMAMNEIVETLLEEKS